MRIDLEKTAEAANKVVEIGNTAVKEAFDQCAQAAKALNDSKPVEEMMDGLSKMENIYNDTILPYLQELERVFKEDLPELYEKLNKVQPVKVTNKSVDEQVGRVDTSNIPIC